MTRSHLRVFVLAPQGRQDEPPGLGRSILGVWANDGGEAQMRWLNALENICNGFAQQQGTLSLRAFPLAG